MEGFHITCNLTRPCCTSQKSSCATWYTQFLCFLSLGDGMYYPNWIFLLRSYSPMVVPGWQQPWFSSFLDGKCAEHRGWVLPCFGVKVMGIVRCIFFWFWGSASWESIPFFFRHGWIIPGFEVGTHVIQPISHQLSRSEPKIVLGSTADCGISLQDASGILHAHHWRHEFDPCDARSWFIRDALLEHDGSSTPQLRA